MRAQTTIYVPCNTCAETGCTAIGAMHMLAGIAWAKKVECPECPFYRPALQRGVEGCLQRVAHV
jgi:hypothetical protein